MGLSAKHVNKMCCDQKLKGTIHLYYLISIKTIIINVQKRQLLKNRKISKIALITVIILKRAAIVEHLPNLITSFLLSPPGSRPSHLRRHRQGTIHRLRPCRRPCDPRRGDRCACVAPGWPRGCPRAGRAIPRSGRQTSPPQTSLRDGRRRRGA